MMLPCGRRCSWSDPQRKPFPFLVVETRGVSTVDTSLQNDTYMAGTLSGEGLSSALVYRRLLAESER
jgi:hypothetical protein